MRPIGDYEIATPNFYAKALMACQTSARMNTLSELETKYPGIEWREADRGLYPYGRLYPCRVCIANKGLSRNSRMAMDEATPMPGSISRLTMRRCNNDPAEFLFSRPRHRRHGDPRLARDQAARLLRRCLRMIAIPAITWLTYGLRRPGEYADPVSDAFHDLSEDLIPPGARMTVWVVYDHPKDQPNHYIARPQFVMEGGGIVRVPDGVGTSGCRGDPHRAGRHWPDLPHAHARR